MTWRELVIGIIGVGLILLTPLSVVIALATSRSEIEKHDEVKIGDIQTAAGSRVSIHVMIGDVLHPRRTRSDLGFDLVPVSYYYDPIRIDGQDVLIISPLLNSALIVASRNEADWEYFMKELSSALYQNVDGISCFSRGSHSCEGTQIEPRIWPAYGASTASGPKGVKYIAAIPLFDPNAVIAEGGQAADTRRRLGENLRTGVIRTLDLAAREYDGKIRSVAFAALGSTSHRGGDSRAFLRFRDGFLTILNAVIESRPPGSVDRVYLVGYSNHTGLYREEVLSALVYVSRYLSYREVATGDWRFIFTGVIGVGFFALGIASYQNFIHVFKQHNRWVIVGKILTLSTVFSGISWGALKVSYVIAPTRYELAFVSHFAASIVCIVVVLTLSKRLFGSRP